MNSPLSTRNLENKIEKKAMNIGRKEMKETKSRLIRIKEVMDMVGVGRSTIYAWEKIGKFPKRRAIGAKAVAWLESDILTWINECQLKTAF